MQGFPVELLIVTICLCPSLESQHEPTHYDIAAKAPARGSEIFIAAEDDLDEAHCVTYEVATKIFAPAFSDSFEL